MGKVPPARSQAHGVNCVHQGWAPVGIFRRRCSCMRNTKISLLPLCTGTKLQHIKFDVTQTSQLLYGHEGSAGSAAGRSMCLHP